MSVIDLIERVDAICRRYEKYDLDNHNEALGSQYDVVEAGIEASLQKLEAATTEEDRAFDVAMKSDVQQTKAYLLEEVSELQKLTLERVNVLSKEEFVAQNNLISMLKERIEAISDGIARGLNKLVVGQLQHRMEELKLAQLQIRDLAVITVSKLKSLSDLGREMKCRK